MANERGIVGRRAQPSAASAACGMLPPMLPHDRLNELLRDLGWTHGELHRRLGSAKASVKQWSNGKRHIPDKLLDWLQLHADARAGIAVPAFADDSPPSSLSSQELQDLLDTLGWGLPEAARRVAPHREAMKDMLGGHRPVPLMIADYLRAMAAATLSAPGRPEDWGAPLGHKTAA